MWPSVKVFVRKWFLAIVAVILLVVTLSKIISYTSARYACHTQWVESNIDYKYTMRGGCLIYRNDGWIPSNNYRVQ